MTVVIKAALARILPGLVLCAFAASAAGNPDPVILPGSPENQGSLRAETIPVSDGADLLVFFEDLHAPPGAALREAEIPLFAVLRDRISEDSASAERLRQIWIFTYSSPSLVQRAAAGVPFFYHRSGLTSGSADRPPHAILDLGEPTRGEWRRLAMAGAQAEVLDPFGAIARLTTHSYRANLGEYRQTHITEIVNLIGDHLADVQSELSTWEVEEISARLAMSRSLFGAFLGKEQLPATFANRLTEASENRGHNWDLLRQAAESNGLYFEPLRLADAPQAFAMIWFAQRETANPPPGRFSEQFLGISDPFHDDRVSHWKGYSRSWTLDRDGVRIPQDTPGGVPVRMIPLAVYSLDYPGVPLLLIDFRNPGRPQRSEMTRRLASDVTSGVLGLTTFGNLGYMAAKSSYLYIHKRHGGATNRFSRRSAFVELRHALGADQSLDPQFRHELMSQLEHLDLDPVEKSWSQECQAAWRQYDALMKYVADPKGMPKLVETDRWQEYHSRRSGTTGRILDAVLHRGGKLSPTQMAQLKQWREEEWARRTPPPTGSPAVASADALVTAHRPGTGAGGQ